MNFEAAPIDNLPSYLQMVRSAAKSSVTPRWWLAPKYESLARDAEGLTWQLRGAGVECLTEEDHFDAAGQRQASRKAGTAAQRWARMFTERYSELAKYDSAFGQLRNVMDLAVVAALIEKEDLFTAAGIELPQLLDGVEPAKFPAPKQVATKANFVKKRGSFTISASGGVQILPWHIADRTEQVESLETVRSQLSETADNWWIQ